MSVERITSKQMTLAEYLEFDLHAEGRYEYFDGEIFEISGATPNHAMLETSLGRLIGNQVIPKGCFIFASTLRIIVPKLPPYRYADLTVICGKPEFEMTGTVQSLKNPTLLIEILSPSTERFDNTEKLVGYKSIPSFCEYLLVSQHRKLIFQYVKHGAFWHQNEFVGGEMLKLVSIDCELSVDEIYQGIEFNQGELFNAGSLGNG